MTPTRQPTHHTATLTRIVALSAAAAVAMAASRKQWWRTYSRSYLTPFQRCMTSHGSTAGRRGVS